MFSLTTKFVLIYTHLIRLGASWVGATQAAKTCQRYISCSLYTESGAETKSVREREGRGSIYNTPVSVLAFWLLVSKPIHLLTATNTHHQLSSSSSYLVDQHSSVAKWRRHCHQDAAAVAAEVDRRPAPATWALPLAAERRHRDERSPD